MEGGGNDDNDGISEFGECLRSASSLAARKPSKPPTVLAPGDLVSSGLPYVLLQVVGWSSSVLLGESCEIAGLQLAEKIRQQATALKMVTNCGGGSMKSQIG